MSIPSNALEEYLEQLEEWSHKEQEKNLLSAYDEVLAPVVNSLASSFTLMYDDIEDHETVLQAQREACAARLQQRLQIPRHAELCEMSTEECIICCYCIPRQQRAVFLPCGHSGMCYGCALDTAISIHGACPLCRAPSYSIVTVESPLNPTSTRPFPPVGPDDDVSKVQYLQVTGPKQSFLDYYVSDMVTARNKQLQTAPAPRANDT